VGIWERAASAFLITEKNFRKTQGNRALWIAESGVEPDHRRKSGKLDGAGGIECITPSPTSNETGDTFAFLAAACQKL
jgi:hypothetical protein